jgi:hypothetical protein
MIGFFYQRDGKILRHDGVLIKPKKHVCWLPRFQNIRSLFSPEIPSIWLDRTPYNRTLRNSELVLVAGKTYLAMNLLFKVII